MRRTRLRMIAIASFFAAIIGEGLVKRAIALLMCGVFGFSSTTCYAYCGNRGEQAIAQIPRVRQQNQSPSEREPPESQQPEFKKPPSVERSRTTINNSPLFTPSFKKLSDNKLEIKLASNEGCNFIITLNKNKNFVYEESIQFISSSTEICQIEPFISRLSEDGKRIEVKTNDARESIIFEQINESLIKRTLTTSTGKN
jgi:hypothetical protein